MVTTHMGGDVRLSARDEREKNWDFSSAIHMASLLLSERGIAHAFQDPPSFDKMPCAYTF